MYKLGHLNLDFDIDEIKSFNYTKSPLNLEEETLWKSGNYSGMTFGGELYDNTNYIPSWVEKASEKLGLKDCGYSFYRMTPNSIIPTHKDHFLKYTKIFNKDIKEVVRAIIFLEDWKSGHSFEIEDYQVANWRAGDYCLWSYEAPHFAANIGVEDRYTLQITGVING